MSHRARQSALARLATVEAGLYGVRFESVFGRRRAGVDARRLRLSRRGADVAYHLEPDTSVFGPGSTLYWVSGGEGSNPYGRESVYELAVGSSPGSSMPTESTAPSGPLLPYFWREVERGENRYYQAGLLDALDVWLWDVLLASPGSPTRRSYPFDLTERVSSAPGSRLTVWLQGASDAAATLDHHVRALVNGAPVAEARWDGKRPMKLEADIPQDALLDGANALEIENVGDTGASYSMVMLDRFAVRYPRRPIAARGVIEGQWSDSGAVEVSGLPAGGFALDVSSDPPRWLAGSREVAGGVRFQAEAGRRYRVVGREAVRAPEARPIAASHLRSEGNRADYLLLGPRELLRAAGPLLDLRRSQGLRAMAVALEDVDSEFGFGESGPSALADFISYAYHHWRRPSPRYVVLLGDGTYDYKDYLGTGVKSLVPARLIETSFLWTASDPSYAAVNGDDPLPDLAIGRLPAASLVEAQSMVEKIVAYEREGTTLGGPVALVADDPDRAGDFERDAEALASGVLSSRNPRRIFLRSLGTADSRAAIRDAFDEGGSLLSYLGHGGIHLWADERLLETGDVASFAPQPRQPIVLTMNCLNGYFHFPYFNSLAEELVKARDRGAIAAFSPSGLSLNGPAHRLHEVLLGELVSGRHARLGDAILAAQAAYAETGAFPELLRIYHLLGDPALRLR
jgi:hypothetical protein